MNTQPQAVRASRPAPSKSNGSGDDAAAKPDALTSAEELATLYPTVSTATIAGRTIEIKKCGLSQGGRIIDAGMPLYRVHLEGNGSLLSLIEDEPAAINALIKAGTDLDMDWIAGLDPLEKVDLFTVWIEANGDFFFRRLFPKVARLLMAAAAFGDGRTSSIS